MTFSKSKVMSQAISSTRTAEPMNHLDDWEESLKARYPAEGGKPIEGGGALREPGRAGEMVLDLSPPVRRRRFPVPSVREDAQLGRLEPGLRGLPRPPGTKMGMASPSSARSPAMTSAIVRAASRAGMMTAGCMASHF